MRITLAAIAFLLLSFPVHAQLTVPFTAQEGYTAAKKLPTNVTSLSFHGAFIFHVNASILQLGMNLNTGKSEAWAYLFKAKDNSGKDTTLVYLMTKTILGTYTTLPLPGNIPLPDSSALMPAITDTWLNSDVITAKLNNDEKVKEYRMKNPDSLYAQSAALLGIPLQQPQWIVTFADEDAQLTCIVDASSGAVQCAKLTTSVSESIYASRQQGSVWPLPARDMVFLRLAPTLRTSNATLELFDVHGEKIRTFPSELLMQHDETLPLSIEGLAHGMYVLQYRSAETIATFPVVISR